MAPQADPAGSGTPPAIAEATAATAALALGGTASPGAAGAGTVRRPAAGIARGAMIIAGFTMLARILGLVRTLVFSQTVGTCG